MTEATTQRLLAKLVDERGRRVVFVSHCLLNQNVRYLGGAFRSGAVEEVVEGFLRRGVGIQQMPCPEQRAWGGVLKRWILPVYGSGGTISGRLRRAALPLFLAYSRWIYRRMAAAVVRDMEDYLRAGFEVVGIVGIGGSPSCGVRQRLDLAAAAEVLAAADLDRLDREALNREAIAANVVAGEGLFMAAVRRQVQRRHLEVRFLEHDLLAEMTGQPIPAPS